MPSPSSPLLWTVAGEDFSFLLHPSSDGNLNRISIPRHLSPAHVTKAYAPNLGNSILMYQEIAIKLRAISFV